LFLSVLDLPGGAQVVYAAQKSSQAIEITRIELPTSYLIFILLGIALIGWGIVEIFHHQDHDH